MSEIFSRRTFLKGSAALVGAAALMSLSGCDGSSKHKVTLSGYVDNEDSDPSDTTLGSGGIGSIDTTKFYDIGNGIKLYGAIGVGYSRHRKLQNEGFYPAVTLLLQNTSSSQTATISPSQFSDIYFDGKRANGVRGFNLVSDGFSPTISLPANSAKSVKVFLNAPSQTKLELNGQTVSFTFSVNGTTKVHCSGTFKDKPTFTITY